MKKNDIYEMVDAQCTKKGENILTVDFTFDVMTNVKQAVSQIDKLVSLADNNDTIKSILQVDDAIQSKYNECIFYKNTIARTEDDIKREVARTRYDIVWEDLLKLRDTLEDYIFDK